MKAKCRELNYVHSCICTFNLHHLFHNLINEGYVTIYMDDILIYTPNNPILHRHVVNDVLVELLKKMGPGVTEDQGDCRGANETNIKE